MIVNGLIIVSIADLRKGEKFLNERDRPTWYLALATEVPKTSFHFQGTEHNLLGTSAALFDAWINPYFEEIQNVDRSTWSKFQRWQVVNQLLEEGDLLKQKLENGTILLVEVPEPEEKASIVEERTSDLPPIDWKPAPILPTLVEAGKMLLEGKR